MDSVYHCREDVWPGILQRLESCGLFLKRDDKNPDSFEVRTLPDDKNKVWLFFESNRPSQESKKSEKSLIDWTSDDYGKPPKEPLVCLFWFPRTPGADRFRGLRLADRIEREILAAGAVCKSNPVAPYAQEYLKTPPPVANDKSH